MFSGPIQRVHVIQGSRAEAETPSSEGAKTWKRFLPREERRNSSGDFAPGQRGVLHCVSPLGQRRRLLHSNFGQNVCDLFHNGDDMDFTTGAYYFSINACDCFVHMPSLPVVRRRDSDRVHSCHVLRVLQSASLESTRVGARKTG